MRRVWVLPLVVLVLLMTPLPAGADVGFVRFDDGLTPAAGPTFVAAGPDGNVWFGENSGDVGRITPDGVITEFDTGIVGVGPITTGPDGNIWFGRVNNSIARMSPDGTSRRVPDRNGAAEWDDGRSDGNLWFTTQSESRIGRIAMDGTLTLLSKASTLSAPHGASPSDRTSAVVHRVGNQSHRTDLDLGVITESELLTGPTPGGIAAGPDGALWFTEINGNAVGRITTDFHVTELTTGISAGAGPYGITLGRDGNLWFVESSRSTMPASHRLARSPSSTPVHPRDRRRF